MDGFWSLPAPRDPWRSQWIPFVAAAALSPLAVGHRVDTRCVEERAARWTQDDAFDSTGCDIARESVDGVAVHCPPLASLGVQAAGQLMRRSAAATSDMTLLSVPG